MFPGFAVALSGLKPKAKYTMKIEVVLADNHRFKFLNGRWLAVGNAEPQSLSETYLHPDSPNSGAFWMRHGVSFRKLKITNNKERPGTSVSVFNVCSRLFLFNFSQYNFSSIRLVFTYVAVMLHITDEAFPVSMFTQLIQSIHSIPLTHAFYLGLP